LNFHVFAMVFIVLVYIVVFLVFIVSVYFVVLFSFQNLKINLLRFNNHLLNRSSNKIKTPVFQKIYPLFFSTPPLIIMYSNPNFKTFSNNYTRFSLIYNRLNSVNFYLVTCLSFIKIYKFMFNE
jgi:hypothetical protein